MQSEHRTASVSLKRSLLGVLLLAIVGCDSCDRPVRRYECPELVAPEVTATDVAWSIALSSGESVRDEASCEAIGERLGSPPGGAVKIRHDDVEMNDMLFTFGAGCVNRPWFFVSLSDPRDWEGVHTETVTLGYEYPTEGASCRAFAFENEVEETLVEVTIEVLSRTGQKVDFPDFVTEDFNLQARVTMSHTDLVYGWTNNPEAQCENAITEVSFDATFELTAETYAYDADRICETDDG